MERKLSSAVKGKLRLGDGHFMKTLHLILVTVAVNLATSIMVSRPAYSREYHGSSTQHQGITRTESASGGGHSAAAQLAGFRGLQLLPSQDDKWIPKAKFDDLVPKGGILNLPVGLVTLTNAFQEPNSQLGAGAKFAFERVIVKRLDGTFLLLGATGDPVALFDPRLGGQQTYPTRSRISASLTSAGLLQLKNPANAATLTFRVLPFPNYRGESLYLLSEVVTPGGKSLAISYTIDLKTKTPIYSTVGSYRISGSAASGQVTFRRTDLTGQLFTLTYNQGRVTGLRGAAGEESYTITTDGTGQVTSLTDKYGYKTTFAYSQGLLTESCNHYGACSYAVYGPAKLTSKSNTENSEVVTRFDPLTGLPTEIVSTVPTDKTYAGARTTYNYEPAQSSQPIPFRLKELVSSIGERPRVVTTFRYDANDRLVRRDDTLNRSTTYGYASSRSLFPEPTTIEAMLAGKVVYSKQLAYDNLGRVIRVQNGLVKKGAPTSAVTFLYDSTGRVIQSRLGDGTVRTASYKDKAFPDVPTALLTNGVGIEQTLNPSGLVADMTHTLTKSRLSAVYNAAGAPTRIVADFPSMAAKTEWSGNYTSNVYLTGETIRETNQGVAATTYAATYTWDSLYRSIVRREQNRPDLNVGLPDARDFPFVSEKADANTQESIEVSTPAGVKPDATGCSPCAAQAFYSASTGAIVPEDLPCNSSVSLVRPPPDTVKEEQ